MNPLTKPFPRMSTTRNVFVQALTFGLFVALFLAFFKPFGLVRLDGRVYLVAAGYGVITTLSMMLLQLGIPRLFPGFSTEDRWTAGREIIQTMGNIVFIASGNLGFSAYMGFMDFTAKGFFAFLIFTLAVGLFPVSIGVLLRQIAFQRKYQLQSEKLNILLAQNAFPNIENTEISQESAEVKDEVEIRDENGRAITRLNPDHLVAAESADNYVKLYHRKNGDLESVMFRASLSSVDASISTGHSIFRSHRTWLVNLRWVRKVEGNARGYTLEIDGIKSNIPVARGRIQDFDAAFLRRNA